MARIFKNRGINNPCTSQYQIKHQKLENQRNRGKALSLDPHKLPSEEEEEEEEEENDNNPKNQIFHGHSLHPYLQQLHEQTLLYSGLDRLNNPNPPLSIPPPPPSATATQPVKKRSFYNPSSSSSSHDHQNNEHARLCEKMGTGDTLNNNNLNPVNTQTQNTQSNPSRLGLRHSAGEIVEVQGGHIVRSIGRKDRHSKVCTAKGPRDRRVRLSAHTAIQFYDVQDRLGYDRPSKAVDWLIKKAKASIDQLAELPAWHPTTAAAAGNSNFDRRKQQSHEEQSPIPVEENSFQQMGNNPNSSFLPPSMDSDSIADTIKSFFPTGASTEHNINNPNSSNSIPFHNFQTQTQNQNRTQDLRLSLQSFQDPDHNNLFTGTQLGFDPSTTPWSDQQHSAEINRFQRLIAWNNTAGYPSGSSGGFLFNPPPPPPPPAQPMLQPLFGQNQFISQRGPLQSSNTQSVRAWIDPSSSYDNHQQHQHHIHQSIPIHPSSFSSIGYSTGGFRIPARIQGEDEEHDGISDKPSSASSDSRH